MRQQLISGRVEYCHLPNRRRHQLRVALRDGVQMQVADRTTSETSELKVDQLL
jgi:hypothetical protein